MKKLVLILFALILAIPLLKTKGQVTTNSSGLAQTYQDVEQAYVAQVQGKEMSKEQEEKILKTMPNEMRAKLEEIKKLDKNKYYQLLRNRFPFGVGNFGEDNKLVEVYGLAYAGEKEKKEKELEIDVELLALKLKNADSNSQQKIKSDLSEKLSELFDIKEAQKQNEVQRLEKRLQELKESLQVRKQNKSEIVQSRIQKLLGDSKYLRWE